MAPALGKIITKLLSRLLGKYLCMKTFFKILFVWQENDLGFSSDFEKIALQKNNYIKPTHTQHQLKFGMIKVHYLDLGERVHIPFMKQ